MKPRLASAYFIYVLLLVIGFMALAEFVVIPKLIKIPRDIYLMGFAATPNTVLDDTPINSLGFTGDAIQSTEKAPGSIRILTLGGSAFFNRNMTNRLKSKLSNICDKKVEILGAALRAHSTMSSILKYKLLSKYNFDIVLIYHGINDLWMNHVSAKDFKEDYSHFDPWYKRNLCLNHSIICRVIYNKLIYRKPAKEVRKTFIDVPGEKVFGENLTDLINAIESHGSVPILMTFAWSIPTDYSRELFESNSLGYNNPTNYDRWPVELWGPVPYVSEGLKTYNRIIRELARKYNLFLIDQEKLMGKDLYYFGDVCHMSEPGTEKFIDNIVAFFSDHNLC